MSLPSSPLRCILLKFYIKPQLCYQHCPYCQVVSYWNSTSNHNISAGGSSSSSVVSYWNSTSNHNFSAYKANFERLYLIEILHQTTTLAPPVLYPLELYLIEILHQTTTPLSMRFSKSCCILLKFYIKPQHRNGNKYRLLSCILLKFYIKPQQSQGEYRTPESCILLKFYIKPQRRVLRSSSSSVVSYWNSTSNHNFVAAYSPPIRLYLIEILHQTTTAGDFSCFSAALYLIEILHQTTTRSSVCTTKAQLYLIEILHQTTTRHSREHFRR